MWNDENVDNCPESYVQSEMERLRQATWTELKQCGACDCGRFTRRLWVENLKEGRDTSDVFVKVGRIIVDGRRESGGRHGDLLISTIDQSVKGQIAGRRDGR